MTDRELMQQALGYMESVGQMDMYPEEWAIAVALRERLAQPEQEFITHEEGEGGWSEWVCPDPKSYLMKCCDCGLVHEAQFGVVRYKSEAEREDCEPVDDPNLQAVFRMRRSEQWSPEDTAHRAGGLPMAEQPAQPEQCECPACKVTPHASDCAVHNEPAYPKGACDCGAQPYPDNFIDALKYDVAKRDSEAQQAYKDALVNGTGVMLGDKRTDPASIYKQPEQEPVAWMHPDGRIWTFGRGFDKSTFTVPLYTSPPASKPLTDEQIWDEVKAADLDWQTGWSLDEDAANRYIIFARAIEAAHGIKENT